MGFCRVNGWLRGPEIQKSEKRRAGPSRTKRRPRLPRRRKIRYPPLNGRRMTRKGFWRSCSAATCSAGLTRFILRSVRCNPCLRHAPSNLQPCPRQTSAQPDGSSHSLATRRANAALLARTTPYRQGATHALAAPQTQPGPSPTPTQPSARQSINSSSRSTSMKFLMGLIQRPLSWQTFEWLLFDECKLEFGANDQIFHCA